MQKKKARLKLERGLNLEEAGLFHEAFESYLWAAKNGDSAARVNLGNLFADGRGCEKNDKKAIYWYKMAVKSGCDAGANNLGAHYRSKGNNRWALYWFERALEMGDTDVSADIDALRAQKRTEL